MTAAAKQAVSAAEIVLAYHARTKHSLERYARGPETLDWDLQPNPFREFAGCPRRLLPLMQERPDTSLAQVYAPEGRAPQPLALASVSTLLELSFGISAWKEYGPDRWALRCNPSSGNLHPTEAYVISQGVPDLEDGLHHYVSRDHALELRCRDSKARKGSPKLWIGLASIHWREAWKYGERAFRYCHLDIGHALGAVRYAAGTLGWRAEFVDGMGHGSLAALMGLDRSGDFPNAEREDADLLISIDPQPAVSSPWKNEAPENWEGAAEEWSGRANRLDAHPMYRWPVIDEVSLATQARGIAPLSAPIPYPPTQSAPQAASADIIRRRRSAQRFDRKHQMSAEHFYRLLDCLLPRNAAPFDLWGFAPRSHPVLFVHAVEGIEPGLYVLPRHPSALHLLRDCLRADFEWKRIDHAPEHLGLHRLMPTDSRAAARTLNCHQAIAGDCCVSLSLLSEFEPLIHQSPWHYRQLHWEAGLIGQVLYLEAEAANLRGTGIGCFFDDTLHDLLGIKGTKLQALYHFAIGLPLTDERIRTLPAYSDRQTRPEDLRS